MSTKNYLLRALMIAALLVVGACADNPAEDAPQAEVRESNGDADAGMDMADGEKVAYMITDDSSIEFVGSKVTGQHDGGFKHFQGEIDVAGDTAEGSDVEVVIDTTSLWSDNDNLTGHLKSADFFDVEQFPKATFSSSSVTDNGDGTYKVTGDLTLHGETKEISFPAEIDVEDDEVNATAEFAIKRFDFGIKYPGKQDDLIRDDVLIKLDFKAERGEGMAMDHDMDMDHDDMAMEGDAEEMADEMSPSEQDEFIDEAAAEADGHDDGGH